jgi:hypothetical protein
MTKIVTRRLTIKEIKSKIPKGFLDARSLDGIPLGNKWHSISKIEKDKFLLLTTLDSEVVTTLRLYFKVDYYNHMWACAHRYIIT